MLASRPYPEPAISVDVVIFTIRDGALQLLLAKRQRTPYKGRWALPGGLVDRQEDLEASALRHLREETGLTGVYLEQLYTFGDPTRDPRMQVVSVAHYALVPGDRLSTAINLDGEKLCWFTFARHPTLAFDHDAIVDAAHQRLAAKLAYSTIALQFLPKRFTLRDLQNVYEIILGRALDKRNFRKQVLALDQIEETGEERRNGNHRPARLYRMKWPGRVKVIK
jgi:8-oxo-dGTP diphosphatase